MYDNRRYLIIPATAVDQINFTQVMETSAETLRYSVDGSQTFVKYELPSRPDIYKEEYEELTHDEVVQLLSTEEWTHDLQNI
jgi:hypothetical protein